MKTALVVESSSFHRELLGVFLETMGYSIVLAFNDGVSAMEAMRRQQPRPSIIIVNDRLEDIDGLRLVRELMEMDSNARIIFISAEAETERESYKAGAMEFIKKPYSLAEVGRAVNRASKPGVVS